jgi:hypothetical protein
MQLSHIIPLIQKQFFKIENIMIRSVLAAAAIVNRTNVLFFSVNQPGIDTANQMGHLTKHSFNTIKGSYQCNKE